jgi:hypothetical protein
LVVIIAPGAPSRRAFQSRVAEVKRNLARACVAAGALGCSSLHGLAVGPVAASSEGRSGYGDELHVRAGAGSSDGADLTTFDVGASARVTRRSQSVAGELGPEFARWLGPAFLAFSPTTGFGFERYAGKLFVDPGLHGALLGGLTLDEATTTVRPWRFLFGEPVLLGPEPGARPWTLDRYVGVRRSRTLLTLELRGGIEPRFTRGTLWTAGILVGLTFVSEEFSVLRPPWPR